MSTRAADRRSVRPLPPATQAKVDRILAAAPKRQRIKQIRAGLQSLIANSEREWTRRRNAGGGNDPPQLLIDVIAIETDFDTLMQELHQ